MERLPDCRNHLIQLSWCCPKMDIRVSLYPQLRQLCWNRPEDGVMDGEAALAIYERNWLFVDTDAMTTEVMRESGGAFQRGRFNLDRQENAFKSDALLGRRPTLRRCEPRILQPFENQVCVHRIVSRNLCDRNVWRCRAQIDRFSSSDQIRFFKPFFPPSPISRCPLSMVDTTITHSIPQAQQGSQPGRILSDGLDPKWNG